ESTGQKLTSLIGNTTALQAIRPADFVDDTFGLPTVTDIIRELDKPGRDPRPTFKTATFKEGVEEIKHLKPGMTLEGVVTNVAAFGAFIDVGVHQDGLAHVSALSKSFVRDPHDVVKSGDVVMVKVLDVDVARKRISLTLRLDDEVPADGSKGDTGSRGGSSQARPAGQRQGGKGGQRQGERGGQGDRPRRDDAPANSAMADALRRAGYTG
ncbi:MAG: S1 RNA-binding domain-containing protein, partial [Terrabacter sp.]